MVIPSLTTISIAKATSMLDLSLTGLGWNDTKPLGMCMWGLTAPHTSNIQTYQL